MMYSGLAFILLRAWMYYIFCIVLVFICYAYLSSLPLSWIIIPRDLYALVIVNSLICFMRFCLSGGFWSPIIIILDLFLLIDIPFSSAHFSAILIVFISFQVVVPRMFVSSAKIYGNRFFSSINLSVKSFVNILNNIHDIPHPYPSPLPMCRCSWPAGIVRLLNISQMPCLISTLISNWINFLNSILWSTISYAFAKSKNNIHIIYFSVHFYSLLIWFSSLYMFISVP